MSTATANVREVLLREVNVLPDDYCPKVLHFIETLKEDEENDDIDDEKFQGILDGINRRYAKVFQRLAE